MNEEHLIDCKRIYEIQPLRVPPLKVERIREEVNVFHSFKIFARNFFKGLFG